MIIVVSLSGGKDSTATAILALDTGHECRFLFADTGHEHPLTYDYLDYLGAHLGITIETVKADFSTRLARKRETVRTKWVDEGAVSHEQAEKIAALLVPTGIPFLDLCRWKGLFPSPGRRFCTEELKHYPLGMATLNIRQSTQALIESWIGVRAQESKKRSQLPQREQGDFFEIYRPILYWTADEVFAFLRRRGVEPNPLYKQGMSRVGCMPCINCNKSELRQIFDRFPVEIERVAEWERQVSQFSKRGMSTFFSSGRDPMKATGDIEQISHKTHGIWKLAAWASTVHGGRQYDLIATSEEPGMCSSVYGLCE